MDSLGCRSCHGWETECGGSGAQLCWDVIVDLDEEDERTAGGKGQDVRLDTDWIYQENKVRTSETESSVSSMSWETLSILTAGKRTECGRRERGYECVWNWNAWVQCRRRPLPPCRRARWCQRRATWGQKAHGIFGLDEDMDRVGIGMRTVVVRNDRAVARSALSSHFPWNTAWSNRACQRRQRQRQRQRQRRVPCSPDRSWFSRATATSSHETSSHERSRVIAVAVSDAAIRPSSVVRPCRPVAVSSANGK